MKPNWIVGGMCVAAYVMVAMPSAVAEKPIHSPTKPIHREHKLTHSAYWKPLDHWLKKQGSPLSGYDFYLVGRKYGIDPDLLIGIVKAETSLARQKQRGSAYNIGSVCSFDSTNTTCHARSYRHGIELIAQTLTNRMLGKHVSVSQLSRYGNPNSAIYASSPINWHRNVVGTMNQLKGKHKNNYPIRKRVGP